jgi:hypothetical protein
MERASDLLPFQAANSRGNSSDPLNLAGVSAFRTPWRSFSMTIIRQRGILRTFHYQKQMMVLEIA